MAFLNKELTYLKNIISFSAFLLLEFFFSKKKEGSDRILFTHLAGIGDLILSSIFFYNSSLFNSEIYFLIKKEYRSLYADYNGPVKILLIDYQLYKWFIPYRIYFMVKLRKQSFGAVYNLDHSRLLQSDEIALLSGAPEIYAASYETPGLNKLFKKGMDRRYKNIFFRNEINEFEKYKNMIKRLTGKEPLSRTVFYLNKDTVIKAEDYLIRNLNLKNGYRIFAVAPLTSNRMKNWQFKNYEELIRSLLHRDDVYVVILGSKKERNSLNKINRAISSDKLLNTAGYFSLHLTAAIISISDLFIGNDSGLLHIAKALKKPSIGIIGGGSYNLFHPYNEKPNEQLVYYKLDCFGCEWKCIYRKPLCLYNVTVEEILNISERILSSQPATAADINKLK